MKSRSEGGRSRIRLVLVNEHALFRESLAKLLAAEHDFEVVAQCSTSSEALKAVKAAHVDVVLLDLRIAKEFIHCAQQSSTIVENPWWWRGVADADRRRRPCLKYRRIHGIFLESDSSSRLMQAIRLVANGEAWIDQKVIQLLANRYPQYEGRLQGNLTDREQMVLDAVVTGLSNRKIGSQLGVPESSIKATLQQLFNKAGVRTRSQLVRIALQGTPTASALPSYSE